MRHTIVEVGKEGDATERNRLDVTEPWAIEAFLEPLLPYLTANYEPAVMMIDAALPMFEDERHFEKEGFYELMGIADEIRDEANANRTKYNQEHFAEVWSVAE